MLGVASASKDTVLVSGGEPGWLIGCCPEFGDHLMIQNKDSRIKIIKNAAYGYRNQGQVSGRESRELRCFSKLHDDVHTY
jgi:hypothetical protein